MITGGLIKTGNPSYDWVGSNNPNQNIHHLANLSAVIKDSDTCPVLFRYTKGLITVIDLHK